MSVLAGIIRAIYEGGVFKPREPVDLEEKTEVEVMILTEIEHDQDPMGWKTWEAFGGLWRDAPQGSSVSEDHDEHLFD